jgi:hypothetical protein
MAIVGRQLPGVEVPSGPPVQVRATLLCCCLGLGLVACGAHRPAARTHWLPTYAFGAIGGGDLDVRDLCPSGAISELSIGSTWATLGVSLATLGVYTPREARVRCTPGR